MSSSRKPLSDLGIESLLATLGNQIPVAAGETFDALKNGSTVIPSRHGKTILGESDQLRLQDLLVMYSVLKMETTGDFEDLFNCRIIVECECAARAARKRTSAHLRELKQHLDVLDANFNDPCVMSASDVSFHCAVAKASGNMFIAGMLYALLPQMGGQLPARACDMRAIRQNVECHRDI